MSVPRDFEGSLTQFLSFKWVLIVLCAACIAGIFFRLHKITENQFVYYDEGEYLNRDRKLTEFIDAAKPLDLKNFTQALATTLKFSLHSNKFLWYALVDMRAFILNSHAWYYTRVVSAIFGIFIFWPLYLLGKKYFNNSHKAFFAVALLALLPSHVYYSRLGMQETLSAFLYLWGVYFYLKTPGFSWRTGISALFFICAYLTNYRLIILPLHVVLIEVLYSLSQKSFFNVRKFVWHSLIYFSVIILVGSLEKGANTFFTVFWMLTQQNSAKGHFSLMNLFSYPYYFIRFEGVVFFILFFLNIFLIVKKEWGKLVPFGLVFLQMFIFSFFQEKGVRYLCVVYPLAAVAVVLGMEELSVFCRGKWRNYYVGFIFTLIFVGFFIRDIEIINFKTDYANAAQLIEEKDPSARILASQPEILVLYSSLGDVSQIPLEEKKLILSYIKGYRYLVVDPQAYISFTKDRLRFSQQLDGYLEVARKEIAPLKVFPHLNQALLERFVLEHNEDLKRSIAFLKANQVQDFSSIKIYDIKDVITFLAAQEAGL